MKKHDKKSKNIEIELDDRKRPYNSFKADDQKVTIEEIEAYRMKKQKFDDPMNNMNF